MLDAARVFPNQEAGKMLQHPLHRQLAARDAPLPDAGDTSVSLDHDDVLVTNPDFDRIASDGGDLHDSSSLSTSLWPTPAPDAGSAFRQGRPNQLPISWIIDVGAGRRY
jgi:hypothetical protein